MKFNNLKFKRSLLGLFALGVIAWGLIELDFERSITEPLLQSEAGHNVEVETQSESQAGGESNAETLAAVPAPPYQESERTVNVPGNAALADEVAADPHGVPPSLTQFSTDVAKRLPAARASGAEASRLMADLREWAAESHNEVIQAYCLSVARDVVQYHPNQADLAENYAVFEQTLSPNARQLSQI